MKNTRIFRKRGSNTPAPERNENTPGQVLQIKSAEDKSSLIKQSFIPSYIQSQPLKNLQRKEIKEDQPTTGNVLESYVGNLNSKGESLPEDVRNFYEPRLGYDFSNVRVHTDAKAAESAQSIHASAYTTGNHIVFNQNRFSPESNPGKALLAHELTHVIQQSGESHTVQRDLIDDAKKALEKKAEEVATSKLTQLGNEPVGAPSGFTGEPKCGPNFCQPFTSKSVGAANLAWAGPLILAGIARKVNSRVVPLWASYLSGGSATKDLSTDFGKDFTDSPTTAATTRFLVGELKKDVENNKSTIMGGASSVTIDFTPRLSTALAAIDDPAKTVPPQMNFGIPADIAGNVAGGIGKDETSFPIGAQPSPFNDSREAVVKATLTLNPNGSITVAPAITYKVKDTIDLCPGDCGAPTEMVATIPLSRFEATGLTGDVPLIVNFDAPASELTPILISPPVAPPPSPTPVAGTVSASVLNIRLMPDTSSAIAGSYTKGSKINVLCKTTGTVVKGNNTWYQTDKGFVSAQYVKLSGAVAPAPC